MSPFHITQKMKSNGSDSTIKVKDITICYEDLGTGAIPIIFIHGFPFDKSLWQPQIEFLKKSNRVIAYDIRGFGNSTTDDKIFSMDLFADDLIDLMDALQIKKAIVCGLSMGGYILLNAVNRYPERFEAIVLSDTQCIADSLEAKEKRSKTIQQIEENGTNDFASAFVKNAFCKESLQNKEEQVEKIKRVILSTSQTTITKTLSALAQRKETCTTLPEISVPTLILCGTEDIVTPLKESEFLFHNIKNPIFHKINNAGHLSNIEQPAEFNTHLNNFISGIHKT